MVELVGGGLFCAAYAFARGADVRRVCESQIARYSALT
jgi:hypothetical protein